MPDEQLLKVGNFHFPFQRQAYKEILPLCRTMWMTSQRNDLSDGYIYNGEQEDGDW